jgi:hypothetical protein
MSEQVLSDAKLAANRENAQKSRGPVTDAGKAAVRLNAYKTGLTGVTVVFPGDDFAFYAEHVRSYETQFEPVGPEESALVQSIADIRWRLNRVPSLEQAILTTGAIDAIAENQSLSEPEAHMVLELVVRRAHEKELRNLHLHENRLARRREREVAELNRLQEARKAREEEKLAEAAQADLFAQHTKQKLTAIPGVGFDFSTTRYAKFMSRLTPVQKEKLLNQAIADAANQSQTQQATA